MPRAAKRVGGFLRALVRALVRWFNKCEWVDMPVYSMEAPVGGWNARDALDNLPETDAVDLINLIPREGYVEPRGRFRAINVLSNAIYGTAGVETMIPYTTGSGNGSVVFAINGTIAGLSGLTSDRWQYVHSHGRIIAVNGSDAPIEIVSGTGSTMTGIGGSGLTASDLIGCMAFKGRVFYWEDGATSFWYPGPGEYKNAAMNEFEMDQFLSKGGTLTLAFTWTLDGGAGMDDLAVFVFSSGEVLVYQGSDPGSVSDWALIGRFEIGEPLTIRGHCRLGADQVILTREGYELISFSLQSGEGLQRKLSDKIDGAVREAIELYGDNYGWDVQFISGLGLLIVNVPVTPITNISTQGDNAQYEQHVYNTRTGAWCKWDMLMQTFCEGRILDSVDYPETIIWAGMIDTDTWAASPGLTGWHGAYGRYIPGETVDTWNDVDDGKAIDCYATQITQFGQRSVRKQATGINFLTTFQTPSAISVTTASDFSTPATPTTTGTGNTESDTVQQSWKVIAETGYAVSFQFGVSSGTKANPGPWKWYATQLTYKSGGPI